MRLQPVLFPELVDGRIQHDWGAGQRQSLLAHSASDSEHAKACQVCLTPNEKGRHVCANLGLGFWFLMGQITIKSNARQKGSTNFHVQG